MIWTDVRHMRRKPSVFYICVLYAHQSHTHKHTHVYTQTHAFLSKMLPNVHISFPFLSTVSRLGPCIEFTSRTRIYSHMEKKTEYDAKYPKWRLKNVLLSLGFHPRWGWRMFSYIRGFSCMHPFLIPLALPFHFLSLFPSLSLSSSLALSLYPSVSQSVSQLICLSFSISIYLPIFLSDYVIRNLDVYWP